MSENSIVYKDETLNGWRVENFQVSVKESNLYNLRCIINNKRNRSVSPGNYVKLSNNGTVIMSNTPAELSDHMKFIVQSLGNILISGLGLGVVVREILIRGYTESITIVEIDINVIKLISKYFKKEMDTGQVIIVHSDIFSYDVRGKYFDSIWHDIWSEISSDNIIQMNKLKRKFKNYTSKQLFWCKKECLKLKREEKYYV